MQTTLNNIRAHSPCANGWQKLLAHLGKAKSDDEPLNLLTILDSNGLDDALWCLVAVDGYERDKRLLAVAFARRVQHLDPTGTAQATLDVAERYAHGQATEAELRAAGAAAWAAADAAWAARDAAWGAARVAACDAARAAAWAAAWGAARVEERVAQERVLRRYLTTGVISWEDK